MTPPTKDRWSHIRQLLENVDRTIPALDAAFGPQALAALLSADPGAARPNEPLPQGRLQVRTEADPDAALAWAIGQRVRRARLKAGLRQEDLAERTGMARPNVVRVERGTHLPSLSTLKRIADALGLQLAELVVSPSPSHAETLAEDSELAEAGLSDWDDRLDQHEP